MPIPPRLLFSLGKRHSDPGLLPTPMRFWVHGRQTFPNWIRVESLLVQDNTAVEQAVFATKSTPKSGGESYLFKGRTQVVYVRYEKSPTGCASIREIIQPATD